MTITFEIPPYVEDVLRSAGQDPSQAVREAAFVEPYRQNRITKHELGQALGLSRLEMDGLLKRYNVTEDLPTPEEYAAEIEGLNKLLPR